MEIKLRKLKGKDIFKISKIVKKLKLDFSNYKKKDDLNLGLQIIKDVFENIDLAEKEINALLSDLSGIAAKDIEELDLSDYLEMIKQLKEDENIMGFFK